MQKLMPSSVLNGFTIEYMVSHKMTRLLLKLLKTDSSLTLSDESIDELNKVNSPVIDQITNLNTERKNNPRFQKTETYTSSDEMRRNDYNNVFYREKLNYGIRHGY